MDGELFLDNQAQQPAQPAEQQPAENQQSQPESANQPLVQQPQTQEPQEAKFVQPQVEDTYNPAEASKAKTEFDKYLDEQFPIKEAADLNKIDKKDPNAINQYFNELQSTPQQNMINRQKREELTKQFQSQQEAKHWEAAYKAYPNLKGTPTEGTVRTIVQGIKSPLQAANFVNKFASEMYNAGFRAARGATQQIPSKPLGKQGKAAPARLNRKAINEKAAGSIDDITEVVAALQQAGEGGL